MYPLKGYNVVVQVPEGTPETCTPRHIVVDKYVYVTRYDREVCEGERLQACCDEGPYQEPPALPY